MIRAILLLLLYISSSIALNIYLRKHPPLFAAGGIGSVMRIMREIWGASLWPGLSLLWITVPVFMATRPATQLPIGLFLLGLGVLLPMLIYSALLVWVRLMDIGGLIILGVIGLSFLAFVTWIFVKQPGLSIWRMLPAFLFLILVPPTLATLLIFGWGMDLVPVSPQQENRHRNALALLLSFYSGQPRPMQRIIQGKTKVQVKGDPVDGLGPGWIMTEANNAVVLKGRSEIRRIVGPGGIFTQADEIVYEILDLRQQVRSTQLQAITRDGIQVRLQIAVVFQIQPGHHTLHFDHPWPYAREGVWHIVFAAEVNPEGRTPLDAHLSRPWSDIPLEVAHSILKQTIINYTLDELYGTLDQSSSPRQEIGMHTRAKLAAMLAPKGFHIVSCGIGTITPVDAAVTAQRIKTWQAHWIRQLMTWQGAAQAQRFEHFAAIQNRARVDLLSHFIEATHAGVQEDAPATTWNLVAYNLLENMEQLAREPEIQTFLPETALPALTELRQRVSHNAAAQSEGHE